MTSTAQPEMGAGVGRDERRGEDKIPMDFGSSLDSECSNPPPPASCTTGTLRSACACPAACVCMGVLWRGTRGPSMMNRDGNWELS